MTEPEKVKITIHGPLMGGPEMTARYLKAVDDLMVKIPRRRKLRIGLRWIWRACR